MNDFFKPRLAWSAVLAASLLTGCLGKSAQEELNAARASIEKGDRAAAIIQVKSALQKSPDMAEARVLLARVLYESGDFQAADVEIDKAAKLGGQESAVAAVRARLLLAKGQAAKVLEQFGDSKLADKTEQVDLLTTLAMAYGTERKPDPALQSVNEALKIEPSNRRAQLVRIRVIRVQGGLEAAVKEVDAYLARVPKDSEAWQIKGEFAASAGNTDEAIDAFRQSVIARKRNLASQSALIRLLLDKKNLVAAAEQVKEMRSVAPKSAETEFLAAALALARGDIKEANERIERVVKVAGGDPRVMQLAATIDLRRGALFEADAQLGKLLIASPDNTAARLTQSQLQLRLGNANKAQAILQPLLDVPSPSAEVLSLAAEIQMSEGDFRSADDYLLKVAKLRPDDVRIRVALAMSAVRSGKLERGIADLRAIAAKDPALYAEMALMNIFMQQRDYSQALSVADGMERKFPGRAGVASLHGRINALRGENEQARQDYERALKSDPQYYPAISALISLDASTGRLAQAQARLLPYAQANPKHVGAQLALIALREKAGAKPEETVQALRTLISRLPTEVEPRQVLVNFQLDRKDNKQALAAAQEAVAAVPDSPELWLVLGQSQVATGAYDQAISAFNNVIGRRPQEPASYIPLAALYAMRNDNAAAVRVLDRALGVKPDYLPAQLARFQLVNASGNKTEALKLAKLVQSEQPQNPMGLTMAGDAEFSSKSWDAAAQNYRAALAKGAGGEVAAKLDSALLTAKRDQESARFETEWLSAHANDETFISHLGNLAVARNDLTQAEGRFRTLLKLRPDNLAAQNNLAWVLGKQGNPAAIELAEKLNAAAPNQPSYMDTLAEIYARNGKVHKAIEIQQVVVKLEPENHACRLSLARYYLTAGQKDAARDELKRLAVLGDKFQQQQEVQKLLASL